MRTPGEILVGLGFLVLGIGFTAGAVKLQIGGATEPQPGFFPFLGGIVLIGLSVIFLLQAWKGRAGGSRSSGKLWGPALVVLTLILYVATLEKLGYLINTAILAGVVLKVLETKFRVLVLVSIGITVASYVIFDRLLGVTLPGGLLSAFL